MECDVQLHSLLFDFDKAHKFYGGKFNLVFLQTVKHLFFLFSKSKESNVINRINMTRCHNKPIKYYEQQTKMNNKLDGKQTINKSIAHAFYLFYFDTM